MSEFSDRKGEGSNVTRLTAVMRDVRIAAADKADVVVDMKEADRARLEILAMELKPVFDEVPLDHDLFDFAISSGLQPRLWIDAISHVQMGRDRRTYRFVRDTRVGRSVLAESLDIKPVAAQVTRYIAERMIERQRMMEGDVTSTRQVNATVQDKSVAVPDVVPTQGKWTNFIASLIWIVIGAVAGGGFLLALLSKKIWSLSEILSYFNL
jgi:hypothetical protein